MIQHLVAWLFLVFLLSSLGVRGQDYVDLNDQAVEYYQQGKPDSALILLNQAFATVDQSDTLNYEQIKDNLLFLNEELGNYKTAALLYSDWNVLNSKVIELYNNGNEASLHYAERALDLADQQFGEKHKNYGVSLNNLAFLLEQAGNVEEAIPFYKLAIDHAAGLFGKNHSEYLSRLESLSLLYYNHSLYSEALPLYQELIEVEAAVNGTNTGEYSARLSNLALLYTDLGEYERALELGMQALQVIEEHLGKEYSGYSIVSNNIGETYRQMGRFRAAQPFYKQSLAADEANGLSATASYAVTLNNLALTYMELGEYEKALPLFIKAKEITAKTAGTEDYAYSVRLSNLGLLYQNMGRYEEALPYFLEALEVAGKAVGKQHAHYATRLNNLARFYHVTGDYEKAENYYQQSFVLDEQIFGGHHLKTLTALHNLSSLYMDMARYDQALDIKKEILLIGEKVLGKQHSDYASYLNSLGALYRAMGESALAKPLYEEALLNIKQNLGEHHADYGMALDNLAIVYQDLGEWEKALELFEKAVAVTEKALGKDHGWYSIRLNNLAKLYHDMGKYGLALPVYEEAIAISGKVYGEQHQEYKVSLNNLASLYSDMGNYSAAVPLYLKANENIKGQLERIFTFSNERDKGAFLSSFEANFEIYQSFLLQAPEKFPAFEEMLYNNQLLLKGLLLNSSREVFTAIRESGDTAVIGVLDKWLEMKNILAHEYGKPANERTLKLDSLEKATAVLETQLVKQSKEFREQQEKQKVNWEDVQANLSPGEIAIEFARFQYNNGRFWTDSFIYVAYVTQTEEQPQMIFLFEENELDQFLAKPTPQALYTPRAFSYDDPQISEKLYHLIFDPLEDYLKGANTLYFSPDGKLHQLALAALSDTSGQLLSENYNLIQLSSTGNIALGNEQPQQSPALFAGGIQYDFVPKSEEPLKLVSTEPLEQLRGKGNLSRGSSWRYLPGTKMEANALFSLYQKGGNSAEMVSDTTASERFIKSLSGNSPAVLHLATHGFFFELEEGGSEDKAVYSTADDPLLRSGLVLAGGNYTWKNGTNPYADEDGILTAYEISHLDLTNTDLVVLSACETGLGDIEGSEGVYGLQRAFRMAGVEYLIMSLWEVPDEETAQFMYTFYDQWLKGGSIREAFNETQHIFSQRFRYEPEKWAAFVLVE